jgi:hypothetical protein
MLKSARKYMVLGWSLILMTCPVVCEAGSVTITRAALTPQRVSRGEPFVLTMQAQADGVSSLNFRVRTPYPVGKGDVPEGFVVEQGKAAVLPDHHSGNIIDNGPVDQDPRTGALRVNIPTAGLKEGTHFLAAKDGESHALDYRNIELIVKGQNVSGRILEKEDAAVSDSVTFELPPRTLPAGEPLVCGVALQDGVDGKLVVQLKPPYTWGKDEVLPGFTYYPKDKMAYVEDDADHLIRDNGPNDRDPADGVIRLEIPTAGWPSGVHVLTLDCPSMAVRAPYGHNGRAYRDFTFSIPSPKDRLAVTVAPSVYVGEGTHFSNLVSLGDGRLFSDQFVSQDGGRTWQRHAHAFPRPNVLPDGTLIGTTYRALPVEGKPGEYSGSLFRSEDGGKTVQGPIPTRVLVPQARAALGHSHHVGPLFGRSIVQRDDGSLISSMYGWFKGDTEPDRYRSGGTMRRSYICESADGGTTWTYLSTVAYEPFLGNEGYSELVIRRLPNADILAIVRTGGNSNAGWQDNPLMVSRSTDGGKTWSPVQRTGVEGVWPDLCVMSDGTLVCSTGRPGAMIMFSLDNGKTWTDHTPIDGERYSGYTSVCEVEPGELVVAYGVRNGLDPETGSRRHMLRACRVTVRTKP